MFSTGNTDFFGRNAMEGRKMGQIGRIAYAGIAILIGSSSVLVAVAIFAAILMGYLKLVEEKELQMRFGSEYVEYKKNTPFIIPIKLGKN